MKRFLAFALVLCFCVSAEAGHRRNNAPRRNGNGNCNNNGNRFNNNGNFGGNTTIVTTRSGLFGTRVNTTVIRN